MKDSKDPTVKQLWELARKGMIWRNQPIENKVDKTSTARLWLEEENITRGIVAAKSAAMHDNYIKWCEERGISGKSVLSMNKLGSFLKENFKSVIYGMSTHYYINKAMHEDEEKKKKRQEIYSRKKKPGKEEKES